MSVVTEVSSISISKDGRLDILGLCATGSEGFGTECAVRISETRHMWVKRLEINFFNKSLDDRYADFCKRLEKAIYGRYGK